MSCSCDFDPPDLQDVRKYKARKPHICEECSEDIKPGDEYVAISSLFESSWSHYALCEYCEHDWKVLEKLGYCGVIGDLKKLWKEAWGTSPAQGLPARDTGRTNDV